MDHLKQKEVEVLIRSGIPVLLAGPAGSGKTTIVMEAAKNANIPYSFLAGTRQTNLSSIVGFINVNGIYSPSPFRKAYVEGHYFNIDEIDAMDPNVLLVFNSLENNTMCFPDGYNKPPHPEFRLMATSNPQDQHDQYVGRSKLDAATLDRFDEIDIDHDADLEKSMVDLDVYSHIHALRTVMKANNSSKVISMRDALRYQTRKDLGLLNNFVFKLTGKSELIYEKYVIAANNIPKYSDQAECETLDELYALLKIEKTSNTEKASDVPTQGTSDDHEDGIPF